MSAVSRWVARQPLRGVAQLLTAWTRGTACIASGFEFPDRVVGPAPRRRSRICRSRCLLPPSRKPPRLAFGSPAELGVVVATAEVISIVSLLVWTATACSSGDNGAAQTRASGGTRTTSTQVGGSSGACVQGTSRAGAASDSCGTCDNACRSDQVCNAGKCLCPAETPSDCGTCADTRTNADHCGACGNGCSTGQVCVDGTCTCPSGNQSTYCSGFGCVDTQTSSNHCGGCGKSCPQGQTCIGGGCSCPQAQLLYCAGVGCVEATTDPKHCGACDRTCSTGEICINGGCECPIGAMRCGGDCVALDTDVSHCGACDMKCGSNQACVAATCGCAEFGLTVCSDGCFDLNSAPKHCGDCDRVCAEGESCRNGVCVCESNLRCGGICASVSDPTNCGECAHACHAGQSCQSGACHCAGIGLSACNGSCVNLAYDESNCGICGNLCPKGTSCILGSCRCDYSTQTYCAEQGVCVYLASDASSCGACGNGCRAGQSCVSGTCRCNAAGQDYCDAAQGCVDLQSNPANCGACGHACRSDESCNQGTCRCPAGAANCASANVCAMLANDAKHCGACGNACPPTQVCIDSTCQCSGAGKRFCVAANACIDTLADSANCGACGSVCPSESSCVGGHCSCEDASLTFCAGGCHDLQSDHDHCGACDQACAINQLCYQGKCQCPPPIVGTPVRVTTDTTHDEKPAVAWDGRHVGVAYLHMTGTGSFPFYDVRLALLNPDGTVASNVALTDYASTPSLSTKGAISPPTLVWNGSEYAVSWLESLGVPEVVLLRVDPYGVAIGPQITVGTASMLASSGTLKYHGLAWSDSYQGYAVAFGSLNSLVFRRLGADGTAMDLPYAQVDTQFFDWQPQLLAAPDGTWAFVQAACGVVRFITFNADGRSNLAPATFSSVSCYRGRWPSLVRAADDYSTVWIGSYSNQVNVNRGARSNLPKVLTSGETLSRFGDALLAVAGPTIALAWTEENPAASRQYRYRLQRFTLPPVITDPLIPVHDIVDILPSRNIAATEDVALVSLGPNALLTVWSDNRWGTAREIYAAPIDLKNCP